MHITIEVSNETIVQELIETQIKTMSSTTLKALVHHVSEELEQRAMDARIGL